MAGDIAKYIRLYHKRLDSDRHHRYRSWGHCYGYFRNARKGYFDIDQAALHLGFYLASWGMYRGVSFLLWKDYKIHRYALQEILKKKYADLWYPDITSPKLKEKTLMKSISLFEAIKNVYSLRISSINGIKSKGKATDTLVSKILLGTMACTPAYARFVVKGMRKEHIPCGTINERHLLALWDFCRTHSAEFGRVRQQLRENGMKYPMMKLVDMYFWEKGRLE